MCFLLAYGQLNPNLKKLSLPANEAPQIINSKNVFFFFLLFKGEHKNDIVSAFF